MKTTYYWTKDADGYLDRNRHLSQMGLMDFFDKALKLVGWEEVKSICEYGCNVGHNLNALNRLFNADTVQGYDLNPEAVKIANALDGVAADVGNLLESGKGFICGECDGTGRECAAHKNKEPCEEGVDRHYDNSMCIEYCPNCCTTCGGTGRLKYDLVITKGLLIHIAPVNIQQAYENLYNMTGKYLLICEYYNPTPVEVEYHGKSGLLFKRDFAGDMLDMYPDLKLVDYGFRYHRDDYPQDDLNWFLLSKEK